MSDNIFGEKTATQLQVGEIAYSAIPRSVDHTQLI